MRCCFRRAASSGLESSRGTSVQGVVLFMGALVAAAVRTASWRGAAMLRVLSRSLDDSKLSLLSNTSCRPVFRI